jgi:hypothetical protein
MKIIKCYTSDVFQENGCLHFEKTRLKGATEPVSKIGALRVICQEWQLPRDMELLFATCFQWAREVWEDVNSPLSSYTPWILIADAGWRHADKITRYKRLWRKLAERWDTSGFSEKIESEIVSIEGVRFVGLARLSESGVGTAFQLMREYPAAIMLTPGRGLGAEISIGSLFSASFPAEKGIPGEQLDLLSMSQFLSPTNVVVVKAGGSFGERETSADFLLNSELINAFVKNGSWSSSKEDPK